MLTRQIVLEAHIFYPHDWVKGSMVPALIVRYHPFIWQGPFILKYISQQHPQLQEVSASGFFSLFLSTGPSGLDRTYPSNIYFTTSSLSLSLTLSTHHVCTLSHSSFSIFLVFSRVLLIASQAACAFMINSEHCILQHLTLAIHLLLQLTFALTSAQLAIIHNCSA